VGKRASVAAVLAEVELGAVGRVQLIGALGAGVDDHHDDRRVAAGTAHQRPRTGDVEEVRVRGVGGEAEKGHADAVRAQVRDLAGKSGVRDPGAIERGDRLGTA
jgi:hypothetical protein